MAQDIAVVELEGCQYVRKEAYDAVVNENNLLKSAVTAIKRQASTVLSSRCRRRGAAAEEEHTDSADERQEEDVSSEWKLQKIVGKAYRDNKEQTVLVQLYRIDTGIGSSSSQQAMNLRRLQQTDHASCTGPGIALTWWLGMRRGGQLT